MGEHKTCFNQSEINVLRKLISQRQGKDKSKQKAIRDSMRNIGFYCGDYGTDMTVEKFNALIENGIITVKGPKLVAQSNTSVSSSLQPESKKVQCDRHDEYLEDDMNVISFPPIEDANSEILVLGTAPGKESLSCGEYYASGRNSMWKIIRDVFNAGKEFNSYNDKTSCLLRNHIAFWDTLKYCKRSDSSDSSIENSVPNDIKGFLSTHPKIRLIIANGSEAASNIPSDIPYIRASSTSNAMAMRYESKLAEWKRLLKK